MYWEECLQMVPDTFSIFILMIALHTLPQIVSFLTLLKNVTIPSDSFFMVIPNCNVKETRWQILVVDSIYILKSSIYKVKFKVIWRTLN